MRTMKTEQEIKKLAMDTFEGRVFTDRHCRSPEEVGRVFMVMMFMKPEDMEGLQNDGMTMIYEYLDKAGPGSINGLPTFFSMQFLTKPEEVIFWEAYNRLKKIKEEFMGPPETPADGSLPVREEPPEKEHEEA